MLLLLLLAAVLFFRRCCRRLVVVAVAVGWFPLKVFAAAQSKWFLFLFVLIGVLVQHVLLDIDDVLSLPAFNHVEGLEG